MFLRKISSLFDFTPLPKILFRNRTLFKQLITRNIISRYRGAMLGLVWSFVQPLMMLCVYTFVFSVIFKAKWGGAGGGESKGAFAIIMFCGMAVFNIFSESITLSSSIITNNPNFVKKVVFPLEILPLAQATSSFLLGMVWFVLTFLGVVFVYGQMSFTMLLLPLMLLPLFLFTLGISYFVSSLAVYMRDIPYIVSIVLQFLFFLTPIFYPLEVVPKRFQMPMLMNPLAILIDNTRRVFIYGQMPDWHFLAIAFIVSLMVLHLGFMWFHVTKKGFADVL